MFKCYILKSTGEESVLHPSQACWYFSNFSGTCALRRNLDRSVKIVVDVLQGVIATGSLHSYPGVQVLLLSCNSGLQCFVLDRYSKTLVDETQPFFMKFPWKLRTCGTASATCICDSCSVMYR